MAKINTGFASEPCDVDADIIAAAVGQLLQWRDGEAASTLATLPRIDPMPRSETKGSKRMVAPLERLPLTKIEMARVYVRDGWRCRYCARKLVFHYVLELLRMVSPGFKGLLKGHHMPFADTEPAVERMYPNVDHVEPRLHAPENLVTACTPCNTRKSDWLGWPPPGPITDNGWDGLWPSYCALIEQRRPDVPLRRVEREWVAVLSQADSSTTTSYAARHLKGCRCEPNTAHKDETAHTHNDAAEARREEDQEKP